MDDIKNVPTHVSIIMDGNGRWARMKGRERTFGHVEGVESVRSCVNAAVEAGVKYLSLFAFSEENWNRPESEVGFLMEMMARCLIGEVPSLKENGVRLLVLGNREKLSSGLKKAIEQAQEQTKEADKLTLIIFLSYSGRWDILQATRRLVQEGIAPEEIDYESISSRLVTAGIPDPDIVVRTSGECRISNYMLWQVSYSELYFTDVMWPDFKKEQFLECLAAFARRDRRFGGVK